MEPTFSKIYSFLPVLFLLTISSNKGNGLNLNGAPALRSVLQNGTVVIHEGINIDTRNYERRIVLANKMQVTLVGDRNTKMSAVSLRVAAGSMNDPISVPGSAHLLEHMITLGSDKYTELEGIQNYIASNGGIFNAKTHFDTTEYHFTVLPNGLGEGLDRLADMIVSPLLNETFIEKEATVVDSENQRNMPNEVRRIWQVEYATAKYGHPYSKFKSGSYKSLIETPKKNNVSTHEALVKFHKDFYSSNLMILAVLGPETLDELQEMVEKTFGKIQNTNATLPIVDEEPFGPGELGLKVEIRPISNTKYFEMMFPIPYEDAEIASTHLAPRFQEEGQNTFLSFLKSKEWAEKVTTTATRWYRKFASLVVHIDLTKEGTENYHQVIKHFLEYVRNLSSKEVKNYSKKQSTLRKTPEEVVAERTNKDMFMESNALHTAFDEEKIITLLEDYLVPTNMRVTIVKYDLKPPLLTEQYFGVVYNVEHFNSSLLDEWSYDDFLSTAFEPDSVDEEPKDVAPVNEFLPANFTIKPKSFKTPKVYKKILETGLSNVWYIQNTGIFSSNARSVVNIRISNPIALSSPVHEVLNLILFRMIARSLTNYSTKAEEAGLYFEMEETSFGSEVVFIAYNDMPKHLSLMVMGSINKFNQSEHWNSKLFDKVKSGFSAALSYTKYKEPCTFVPNGDIFLSNVYSSEDSLSIMDEITFKRLELYFLEFMSRLSIQWTFWGNTTPEEAVWIASICETMFKKTHSTSSLSPSEKLSHRDVEIPEGSNWIYKATTQAITSTKCTRVLLQASHTDARDRVAVKFLASIANEAASTQLRSREQLGYFVGAKCARCANGLSVVFEIFVESEQSPAFVETRIDSFLMTFGETLKNMSPKAFALKKKTFATTLEEDVGKLSNAIDEIKTMQYDFERTQKELLELELMSLAEFLEFYEDLVSSRNGKQRRVSIHVIPAEDKEQYYGYGKRSGRRGRLLGKSEEQKATEIQDIAEWKQGLRLFPSRNVE